MLFEDLSKATLELLSVASLETTLVRHGETAPEHLLLGLLVKIDNPASRVLRNFGMSSELARSIVKKQNPPFASMPVVIHMTQPTVAVMNRAVELAKQSATSLHLARPGHVLTAIIELQDAHVLELFEQLNIDPEAVRLAIAEEVKKEES